MSGQRELYFANLSYPEVERALDSSREPVLLLPVGATEPHGPHAPLSADAIISIGMCERAAAVLQDDPALRPLILPPVPYGVTRYAAAFPGAVHVNEGTLYAIIVDVCTSLAEQRFRNIVIVNNHFEPAHVGTLHRAIDDVHESTRARIGYLDLTRQERARRLTPEFQRGESRADKYETSLLLAERPELIDQATMRELPAVPINLAASIATGKSDFPSIGLERAYAGSPAGATAEHGEEIFGTLVAMLIEVVRELVAGGDGRDEPGLFGRV
ncbi:MAG: creatininase family protein [Actinomycetia bacterium]|nr:creatininase family protein [Actinomycetes bacterium]